MSAPASVICSVALFQIQHIWLCRNTPSLIWRAKELFQNFHKYHTDESCINVYQIRKLDNKYFQFLSKQFFYIIIVPHNNDGLCSLKHIIR